MAANTSPVFGKSPNNAEATFTSADTTDRKAICVAVTDGTILKAINVCSNDTAVINLKVFLEDGSTEYLLGTVPIPALSGTDGVEPAVNALDPTWIPGLDENGHLYLEADYEVRVGCLATMTAAKTMTVVGLAVDLTA